MARDVCNEHPDKELKLRLICNREKDGRTYNLPTTSEVAALVIGDIEESYEPRDIVVRKIGGHLEYLNELHPLYMPLQYPLIYINGEDGYRTKIKHRGVEDDDGNKRPYTTMREWFAFMFQDRVVVYTVEFQKRGLPHAHLCLFMQKEDKLPNVEHVDPYISAEIPDKNEDPELYNLVSELMMHGPCAHYNKPCSCVIDNKCTKNFPKNFQDETSVDTDGFPLYRRRDNGAFVQNSDIKLDNRSVVPYNIKLLKRYQAHINVEWCNQGSSIKYIFKYINKGPDRATMYFANGGEGKNNEDRHIDEIKELYDCRYMSACEASWRIFAYDVHYRVPEVMRLPFHLPGKQQVIYGTDDDIENVLEKTDTVSSSMFELWMECNRTDHKARKLIYSEFPTQFVWHLSPRGWQRIKSGLCIGRVHAISLALGEAYFLRVLINRVKGPRSYEEIRTVNGQTYNTFRDACYALGLLDDDTKYIEGIEKASLSGSELQLTEEQIKNLTLLEIQKILQQNNTRLSRYKTMPFPDEKSLYVINNRLILDEQSYDQQFERKEFQNLFTMITSEQRAIFDTIKEAVHKKNGGAFFVYGYGGTGKTYLWKTLTSAIRSEGNIVLNVASSGIASLLLSGGRTAHSRFHIPINLNEDSSCVIERGSDEAELLQFERKEFQNLFTMIISEQRAIFDTIKEAVHKKNGGAFFVYGYGGTGKTYLWKTLTSAIRSEEETKKFSQWLLDIGEGKVGGPNDGTTKIEIPTDLLIEKCNDPVTKLIQFVYPDILNNKEDPNYFQQGALLAPTNEVVHEINDRLIESFPGESVEYLSSDYVSKSDYIDGNVDPILYSTELLNGLKIAGLPNHRLILKVGVPVMLLRNIDQKKGL
ncbi:uncharacterized protein LOC143534816 [Bidens hawaiensis]|uniref:uncharacterized protein LOC143534816 n=1 Tax=Bidens hawaiensis TaxID=980011 RepID=UPI0040496757